VALEHNIPYTTTMAAARATLDAIRAQKRGKLTVKTIQEYHEMVRGAGNFTIGVTRVSPGK
jgi:carbamoyl-phosphate synthase large subunit